MGIRRMPSGLVRGVNGSPSCKPEPTCKSLSLYNKPKPQAFTCRLLYNKPKPMPTHKPRSLSL